MIYDERLPWGTAPKDGTQVLAYTQRVGWAVLSWCYAENADAETWAVDDGKYGPYQLRGDSPTFWMRLPEPPSGEGT